jgi:hypothetical protein
MMYCPYCKKRIQLTRDIKTPKWIASCDCATAEHAWMERAEKDCLVAAYKNSKKQTHESTGETQADK